MSTNGKPANIESTKNEVKTSLKISNNSSEELEGIKVNGLNSSEKEAIQDALPGGLIIKKKQSHVCELPSNVLKIYLLKRPGEKPLRS